MKLLTYKELKALKGKLVREKSTGAIYTIDSVSPRFIRIGTGKGGIRIATQLFLENKQNDFELLS